MKILPRALLDELATRAAARPRARPHPTTPAPPADTVQRFIVVALRDSYFRPHRHATRSELAVVMRGQFDVVTFAPEGRVLERHAVGDGTASMAYETPEG